MLPTQGTTCKMHRGDQKKHHIERTVSSSMWFNLYVFAPGHLRQGLGGFQFFRFWYFEK